MDELNEKMESGELHEHYKFVADAGQEPLRVDKFLMNFIENATRNKIQSAAKEGNIIVNEVAVKPNYRVKAGDEVKVVLSYPPRDNEVYPEDIPLDIVYEDDDVIVVNKDHGMVVHPGHGNYTGTLVNALRFHFDNLPDSSKESDRPGLVHRIDKGTSGLLVIAKNEHALANLSKQFFDKTTEREYVALVWGDVEEEEGTIEGNIGRHIKNRLRMAVFPDGESGKPAITHYKVIERFGYITMVSCRLETGRTHQIRAHFKYIGHTLFNDERYGGEKILKGTTFTNYKQFVQNCFKILPRQALHARTLGFVHPTTNEFMKFESPIPNDIQEVIGKWRVYSKSRNETDMI